MKYISHAILLVLLFLLFATCKKHDSPPSSGQINIIKDQITLNPTGYAPLSAIISLETSVASKIFVQVVGKHGTESNVAKTFDTLSTTHTIPILGLYADYNNTVELTFKDASGADLGHKSYQIKTAALPSQTYPGITIDTKKEGQFAPGMTLVSYYGYQGSNAFPQTPFVFDEFGDIRWYLDFHSGGVLSSLFYDDGMERLQNGNLYFGDVSSNAIYEMDMLGNIINTWQLPGYLFHHEAHEKPNGNFLVTVSKQGSSTSQDYIIEIDRNSKQIIKTWNLRESLQYSRQVLEVQPVDWIHVNAIIYDAGDNTIIISGRIQGLIKLDENNKVVYILGCHKGWGTSGNGTDLNQYLLQPLDKNNVPIADTGVLNGSVSHPDFEWSWFQHAPLVLPDGHVMLFDNGGDNRNFSGSGQYSRAVEYDIDAANKTVKQVWEYGKERGAETFAHIVSDVDYIPGINHVIFSPGAVNSPVNYGKIVELDYATKEVVFEATLTTPQAFAGITFHRTERLTLYP